ncbi:flagellar basal body P-ring formation protein FlgA [Halomonas sp. ATCHA]|uniref:Flagella basal body P-ring formation protein FlgA n=2 Tax=Halomonas llamarensis TaxID=2945104 RepID=A0ABT0SNE4_9GAMM|nr:flagellar basal body P-ring formation chaperone FlgA [Halomonas llamarensis]MCL7929304.1 flagellar basal body P-ring formation protein FlgA [Halomonas llamarensis]
MLVTVVFIPNIAFANDEVLTQRVHQFLYEKTLMLGEEVVIDLRAPSPHLPACINPTPFLPNADQAPLGRISVGVRCGEQQSQVRYLQAQVDVIGPYAVASEDISRGTLITESMLDTQRGNLGELSSRTLTEADSIVGNVALRPIRSGSSFQAHDIQAPRLVERGQRVTVIAEGPAFRIAREGEAMDDGGLNERIRVRFGSREILEARITGDGVLQIDF